MAVQRFPYLTDYVNELFDREKSRFDYVFIRPVLTSIYYFVRLVLVPIKFLLHRRQWGFENKMIDRAMGFGIKHFASEEALELIIRHVQIEPMLYRYILSGTPERMEGGSGEMLKGIDGDFSINSIKDIVAHGLTICHDDLSYEIMERFDKDAFLKNIEFYRSSRPEDIEQFGHGVMEQNRQHSLQIFGATNVVIFIVIAITIFGDIHTLVRALNSFDSDSVVLWCLKHICANDQQAMIDLDFYLQTAPNRSHYNNSPFLSDPSQYLYYHIAFDEFAYELLRKNPDAASQA